jgi:hypothetical protein
MHFGARPRQCKKREPHRETGQPPRESFLSFLFLLAYRVCAGRCRFSRGQKIFGSIIYILSVHRCVCSALLSGLLFLPLFKSLIKYLSVLIKTKANTRNCYWWHREGKMLHSTEAEMQTAQTLMFSFNLCCLNFFN